MLHRKSIKLCMGANWYSELKVVLIINFPPLHYPVMIQMNNWKFNTVTVTQNVSERSVGPSFFRHYGVSWLKPAEKDEGFRGWIHTSASVCLITNSFKSHFLKEAPLSPVRWRRWSNGRILIKRNPTDVFHVCLVRVFASLINMCIHPVLLWSVISYHFI